MELSRRSRWPRARRSPRRGFPVDGHRPVHYVCVCGVRGDSVRPVASVLPPGAIAGRQETSSRVCPTSMRRPETDISSVSTPSAPCLVSRVSVTALCVCRPPPPVSRAAPDRAISPPARGICGRWHGKENKVRHLRLPSLYGRVCEVRASEWGRSLTASTAVVEEGIDRRTSDCGGAMV